jgi:1,4-alpha-glucan branching enzyme
MIKLAPVKGTDTVKITFALALDEADQAVSVVGDFNGWNPLVHPLKKRSNGTRSVTVEAAANADYRFKYLVDGGEWRNDPDAEQVDSGHGTVDSLVRA